MKLASRKKHNLNAKFCTKVPTHKKRRQIYVKYFRISLRNLKLLSSKKYRRNLIVRMYFRILLQRPRNSKICYKIFENFLNVISLLQDVILFMIWKMFSQPIEKIQWGKIFFSKYFFLYNFRKVGNPISSSKKTAQNIQPIFEKKGSHPDASWIYH